MSLRARFATAFGALLLLATLNIGAFYWGARQRERVFHALRATVARHGALTEAQAGLLDHVKRVRVNVDLLGVDRVPSDPVERRRALVSVEALRRRVAEATAGGRSAPLRTVRARTDSLAAALTLFHERQGRDLAGAIEVVATGAGPLAERLLDVDFPAALAEQRRLEAEASAAFMRTDRTSSALVWTILALSGLLGAALAYSLSRDLLRAIDTLHAGVERFGAGELGHRVAVRDCEELERVGASLNTMAGRLRHARDELEVRNAELAHLAFRDPLTQLANRSLFREQVERALDARHRHADDVSILFIDLDDFKSVNDTLGHDAGDRLLFAVASRLLDATRGSDTVARLGGDEFAILLHRVREPGEAVAVAERVLASVRAPFATPEGRPEGGRSIHVTASVGVVFHRAGAGAEELLRDADVAMYRAKAAGKGQYAVFAPEMHAELLDRVELQAELREALDRHGLDLVYQPIVRLADRSVTGFEALVRWPSARRGPVAPAVFIPLAEEIGSIVPLGRWVIARACREALTWQPAGSAGAGRPDAGAVGVSINVSGRQLEDPAFVDDVRDALDASGLDPRCLTLEITETAIMRDSVSTLARLRALKTLGIRVAIDDFGTGYSSLAYLRQFPVDTLKIDKVFIDQIARGGHDAALARTIVALGDVLQLRTVAEGIEHADQHAELLAAGCELGQGYLFSRPLDAAGAAVFLRGEAWRPPPVWRETG